MRLFLSLACPPRFKKGSLSLSFFLDPSSDKALSETLEDILLRELFSERQSSGQVASHCRESNSASKLLVVREPLGMSLGEPPGELLPMSSRTVPMTKLLRPIQVAGERREPL